MTDSRYPVDSNGNIQSTAEGFHKTTTGLPTDQPTNDGGVTVLPIRVDLTSGSLFAYFAAGWSQIVRGIKGADAAPAALTLTSPGTAATNVSGVAQPGGATSLATGVGGAGASVTSTAGAGGAATGATAATGGAGGAHSIVAGAGGAISAAGTDVGGAGGAANLTAGAGGAATVGSSTTGGAGGAASVTGGAGGAGTTAGGAGGGVNITGGASGAGGNIAGSSIVLTPGAPTGSGAVGSVKVAGQWGNTAVSATSPVIAASGTITTAGVAIARVTPSAARAAIVLQAGTFDGQRVIVMNEAAAANTITFDVAGTSNVADGVSTVIAGLTAVEYVWGAASARWFALK